MFLLQQISFMSILQGASKRVRDYELGFKLRSLSSVRRHILRILHRAELYCTVLVELERSLLCNLEASCLNKI